VKNVINVFWVFLPFSHPHLVQETLLLQEDRKDLGSANEEQKKPNKLMKGIFELSN
jgi:hypothetical protein